MGIFNIIWFIIFGWWQALVLLFASGFFAITIIGIPLSKSLLQFAKLSAFPYGKEIIREAEVRGTENVSSIRRIGGLIINIIWIPFGLLLSIAYIISAIIAFFTIIGIPVGVVYARMGKFVMFPMGAKVVTGKQAYASAVANEIDRRSKITKDSTPE